MDGNQGRDTLISCCQILPTAQGSATSRSFILFLSVREIRGHRGAATAGIVSKHEVDIKLW